MGILDTIAPRKGPKQRRLTKTFIAKATLITGVVAIAVFISVSVGLYENDRTVPEIAATRVEDDVIVKVQEYLQTAQHRGFLNQDDPVSCWDVFENAKFGARYQLYGFWQVDAFYSRVRYFWRVDDVTLKVTRDTWVKSRGDVLKRIYTPTIEC